MSSEPPPPYPGGPTAPLLEEKSGAPPTPGRSSPAVMQPPPGMPLPPADIGPPPYEPPGHPMPQPGFIPPHMSADGTYMPPAAKPTSTRTSACANGAGTRDSPACQSGPLCFAPCAQWSLSRSHLGLGAVPPSP
ncbi:cell death inducing p53 target 1, partial [Homo sapiens]